jgi:hypothetical protein
MLLPKHHLLKQPFVLTNLKHLPYRQNNSDPSLQASQSQTPAQAGFYITTILYYGTYGHFPSYSKDNTETEGAPTVNILRRLLGVHHIPYMGSGGARDSNG